MSTRCLPQLPGSWVDPATAMARIGNFMMRKHRLLTQLLNGRPEATGMRLTVPEFKSLIKVIKITPGVKVTGVRLHFAAYKLHSVPSMNALIPTGEQELLTFVFSPIIDDPDRPGENKDSGHFIVVDFAASKAVTIDKTIAESWVYNYRNTKMKLLEDSMHTPGDQSFRETRSLVFDKIEELEGWIDEINCWELRGEPIQGVYFSYAALVDNNILAENQLSVIISLDRLFPFAPGTTMQHGGHGHSGPDAWLGADESIKEIFVPLTLDEPDPGNYDTAHPCPPDANCEGSSLP